MKNEHPSTFLGFTLIEVITALVVFSFAGLIAATVLGAGYLRVEQIVTQQEDVRDVASCVERIKAEYAGQKVSSIDEESIEKACGLDVAIQPVGMNVNETSTSENYKEVTLVECGEKTGVACSLWFISVSRGGVKFDYVLRQ